MPVAVAVPSLTAVEAFVEGVFTVRSPVFAVIMVVLTPSYAKVISFPVPKVDIIIYIYGKNEFRIKSVTNIQSTYDT